MGRTKSVMRRMGTFACWAWLWCAIGLQMGCSALVEEGEPAQQSFGLLGGTLEREHRAVGALVVHRQQAFCSGTLIEARTILTAAHCAEEVRRLLDAGTVVEWRVSVQVGEESVEAFYRVKKAVNYPTWSAEDGEIPQDDIGLLFLERMVRHTSPLLLSSRSLDGVALGTQTRWIGFGWLQTEPFPVHALRRYEIFLPMTQLSSDRLEGYAVGKSACHGDSGGSVLLEEKGGWRVVAVASYGMGTRTEWGQARCDGTSVAFRVDTYRAWITQTQAQSVLPCKQDAGCGAGARCTQGRCELVMAAPHPSLCRPCSVSQQCGGGGNLCARMAEGRRCLQACGGADECPQDYACGVLFGVRQCIPTSGACKEEVCKKDVDCGAVERCEQGRCVAPVLSVQVGVCAACEGGVCGVGQRCVRLGKEASRCLQDCVADVYCPTGFRCQDIAGGRSCVPNDGMCGCQSDRDCPSTQVCRSGRCERSKGRDLDQPCDEQHPCSPGLRCAYDHNNQRICQRLCGLPAKKEMERSLGIPGSFCRDGACALDGFCRDVAGYQTPICFAQTCISDQDCSQGGRCAEIKGVGRSCVCNQDKDCKTSHCEKDLFRRVFRKELGACAPPPPSLGEVGCLAGSVCKDANKEADCHVNSLACVCRRPREVGETCGGLYGCAQGLKCATTSRGSLCLEPCVWGSSDGCTQTGGACVIAGERVGEGYCGCSAVHGCSQGKHCQGGLAGGLGYCLQKEQGPRCGDGTCTYGEDCESCPTDCGCSEGALCYQGVCQAGGLSSWLEASKAIQPTTCGKDSACSSTQPLCEEANCPTRVQRAGCQAVKVPMGGLEFVGLLVLVFLRKPRRRNRTSSRHNVNQENEEGDV